jgi:ATPase family associated with various cellular activities (AAA)
MSGTTENPRSAPYLAALRTVQGGPRAPPPPLPPAPALLAQTTDLLKQLAVPPAMIAAALVIVIVAGLAAYLRTWMRERRRPRGVTMSVFIGAEPFTAQEKDRFFGRTAEIDEIARKLRNRDVRFLVLFGQSGCGKTSLIQAGVMPVLEAEGTPCVYTRPYDHPEKSLKSALRQLAGKRGIVFIDQFEELFTAKVEPDEQRRFLDVIVECLENRDGLRPQLVFALRHDFFYRLTEIEDYVGDIFERSQRKRIEPFTVENARTVLEKSLARDAVMWDSTLIDRVLDDLRIDVRDSIGSAAIVLPAELQIVCQMIQRRGWSDARQYPGKERLIRDYVIEAIETSRNGEQTKRILLKLIHENGLTRSRPRTAAEIAADIGSLNEAVAAKHLQHLDRECRLVNEVVLREEAGSPTAYELAHEYLVDVINQVSGSVMDRARRANVLLQEYRGRAGMNDRVRIPYADAYLIRRYATEPITPVDRRLLRRSELAFWGRVAAVTVVPVAIVSVIRYGTVHFDYRRSGNVPTTQMTVNRGLPFMAPVLGSERVLIDTALASRENSSEGRNYAGERKWIWDPRLRRTPELLLRWRLQALQIQRSYAYADPEERSLEPNVAEELTVLGEEPSRLNLAELSFYYFSQSPPLMTLRRIGVPTATVISELERRSREVPHERADATAALIRLGRTQSAEPMEDLGSICTSGVSFVVNAPATGVDVPELQTLADKTLAAALRHPNGEPFARRLVREIRSGTGRSFLCATDLLLENGNRTDVASALAHDVSRHDPETRLFAADRLLKIEPSAADARETVIRELGRPALFRMAAGVVQSRRLRDPRIEGVLTAALADRANAWFAAKALAASGYRGEPLLAFLGRKLASDRSLDAIAACELLVAVGRSSPAVQNRLASLILDDEPNVSSRARELAVRSRSVSPGVRGHVLAHELGQATKAKDLELLVAAGYTVGEIEVAFRGGIEQGVVTPFGIEFLASRGQWSLVRDDVRKTLVEERAGSSEISKEYASVELVRPAEMTRPALDRLRRELSGSDATRSQSYRRAVEHAIANVVIREMKRTGLKDPIAFERELLAQRAGESVIVRRSLLAAVELIDETIPLADFATFKD